MAKEFTLRGLEMTRLETFIDAGFAFALTMLVISIDRIPTNHAELIQAFKGAPAFVFSAILVGIFWRAHWHWSRRYGLEDGISTLLSWALMITVLVYIYPLKIMFAGVLDYVSDGYFPGNFQLADASEARELFAIYSAGFTLIALQLLLLNGHALRCSKQLKLDEFERFLTKSEIGVWSITALTGLASIVLSITVSRDNLSWSGWVYFFLPLVLVIYHRVTRAIATRHSELL